MISRTPMKGVMKRIRSFRKNRVGGVILPEWLKEIEDLLDFIEKQGLQITTIEHYGNSVELLIFSDKKQPPFTIDFTEFNEKLPMMYSMFVKKAYIYGDSVAVRIRLVKREAEKHEDTTSIQ